MIRDALQSKKDLHTPAVLGGKSSVSYMELACRAARLQAALPWEVGRPIAALVLPDGADFLAALFAVLQAGWTALPINSRLSADELSDLFGQIPLRLVVTSAALRPHCHAAMGAVTDTLPILVLEELPTHPKHCPAARAADPDSPMLLLASSGTTGRMKMVQLSENNVSFSVHAYLRHMGYERHQDPAPRYALGTPLFGIYGLLIAFSCVVRGFPMLPMADRFTLDALYRASQEDGISHYDGGALVATLMDRTLGRPNPYDISALRYLGFGGSKVPDGTLERLSAAYPQIRFWSGYGMTEASPLIAQPFQDLPLDKLGSVGIPLPGVAVRLETSEGLTEAPNLPGEIVAQGPNIMLGYYGDEAATQEILRGGWLHTGDIGYFDNDGYLYICGRKKNMIIVRGFNVYPEEVENRLLSSPLIKDCMVYCKTDEPGTETVCADVIPSSSDVTPEAIQSWCAEHLADYKRPRHIRLVEAVERTSTGKIRRT